MRMFVSTSVDTEWLGTEMWRPAPEDGDRVARRGARIAAEIPALRPQPSSVRR